MIFASKIMLHTASTTTSLLTWFVLVSKKGEKTHAEEIQVLVFPNFGSSHFKIVEIGLVLSNI